MKEKLLNTAQQAAVKILGHNRLAISRDCVRLWKRFGFSGKEN